jgi:hypothetical protein
VSNVQSYATQEYRSSSGPRSIPEANRYARKFFSAANQSISANPAESLFFSSAGTRVFAPVHDDPRHKNRSVARVVARGSGLFSHGTPVCSSAQKRHSDDVRRDEIEQLSETSSKSPGLAVGLVPRLILLRHRPIMPSCVAHLLYDCFDLR